MKGIGLSSILLDLGRSESSGNERVSANRSSNPIGRWHGAYAPSELLLVRFLPLRIVFEKGTGLADIPSVAVTAFGLDFSEGGCHDAIAAGEEGFGGFEVVKAGPEDWR